MEIRVVENSDKENVMSIDKHVNDSSYRNRVYTKSGYVYGKKGYLGLGTRNEVIGI